MSSKIYVPETYETSINGKEFTLTALPAMYGLELQYRINEEGITPQLIKEVITKGATTNGIAIDETVFNRIFRRDYKTLMELFNAITVWNFGDVEDETGDTIPNE